MFGLNDNLSATGLDDVLTAGAVQSAAGDSSLHNVHCFQNFVAVLDAGTVVPVFVVNNVHAVSVSAANAAALVFLADVAHIAADVPVVKAVVEDLVATFVHAVYVDNIVHAVYGLVANTDHHMVAVFVADTAPAVAAFGGKLFHEAAFDDIVHSVAALGGEKNHAAVLDVHTAHVCAAFAANGAVVVNYIHVVDGFDMAFDFVDHLVFVLCFDIDDREMAGDDGTLSYVVFPAAVLGYFLLLLPTVRTANCSSDLNKYFFEEAQAFDYTRGGIHLGAG